MPGPPRPAINCSCFGVPRPTQTMWGVRPSNPIAHPRPPSAGVYGGTEVSRCRRSRPRIVAPQSGLQLLGDAITATQQEVSETQRQPGPQHTIHQGAGHRPWPSRCALVGDPPNSGVPSGTVR